MAKRIISKFKRQMTELEKVFSGFHEKTRVWRNSRQLAIGYVISRLIISYLLFNMVFSFVFFCFFPRFDHCSSNLCKLPTSNSLSCKEELSYKHTVPQSPSYMGYRNSNGMHSWKTFSRKENAAADIQVRQ